MVLPAFGGDTTSPRWPKPIGTNKSISRGAIGLGPVSSVIRLLGWIGVSFSNGVCEVANLSEFFHMFVSKIEVDVCISVSYVGYRVVKTSLILPIHHWK